MYSEHSGAMLGESPSLQFGRLRYYRLLEAITGDARIGDFNEGRAVTKVSDFEINDRTSQDIINEFDHGGFIKIKPNSGNVIKIGNGTFVNNVDCFVLSLGMGDFEPLADEFARCGPEAYDSAFRLMDLNNLLERICKSEIDGRPIEDIFSISRRRVKYTDVSPHDFSKNNTINLADPFKKNKNLYIQQREYRVILTPKIQISDTVDHIRFNLPPGPPLFESVLIDKPTRQKSATQCASSAEEFLEVVRTCFREWENREKIQVDMNTPDWIEIHQYKAGQEQKAFEPIRKKIVQAYWRIRSQRPGQMMDDAIIRQLPPFQFNNRVMMYANILGLFIPPPP